MALATAGSHPCRRYLVAAAVLIVIVLGLSGRADAQTGTNRFHDIESIVASGVLRVGISRFDIPPFHRRRPNGLIEGKETELVHQIARALSVKVVFVDDADTFDEVIALVASDRADIALSALTQNFAAAKSVRFSAPYMTLRHALLYDRTMVAHEANGGAPEDVLREFRGRIGVIAASPFVAFSDRNFPWAVVTEYPTWEAAVIGLRGQDVDALYSNEYDVRRVLKDAPGLHVRYGAAAMNDKQAFLAVAICDFCTKLQEFINFYFAQNAVKFSIGELLSITYKD